MRYKITKNDFHKLLKYLLKEKIVSEILSGKEKRNRFSIKPEFISDPKKLEKFPLSQLSVYGYSRTDSTSNSLLHSKKALNKKIGVVARACDVRAMVELEKKKQLKWENLFIIAFHDMGYIPDSVVKKYFKKNKINDSKITFERLIPGNLLLKIDGKVKKLKLDKKLNITDNCSRCIQKSHPLADFLIGTYSLGEDDEDCIISPQSSKAKELIEKLNWKEKIIGENLNKSYEKIAQDIIDTCAIKREKDLKEFMNNVDRFELLTKCTACGLCVKSCPVCYCVTCNLLDSVRAKTMDKMTFLSTRFTHIGDTCIECGKCSVNCPMNIPLDLVFQSMRKKFKDHSAYEAGAKRNSKILRLDVR